MNATAIARPASVKQVSYLASLLVQKDTSGWESIDWDKVETSLREGTVTLAQATFLIDVLVDLPRKPVVHEDGEAVTTGYYFLEGEVYQVVESKAGRLYGKHFTEAGYEYQPGALRMLKHAARLTVEMAAEAGVKTGRCCVCARLLTDPESVANGIGPICQNKL